MTVTEPTTVITDYLLGTLSEICGLLLVIRNRQLRQRSIAWWSASLMTAAVASYAGGTYHGFHATLGSTGAAVLWKVTTISMGVASFLLLAAVFTSALPREPRRWLIAAAALKLVVYVGWMLEHDDFRFVVYEYGSTLAVMLFLVLTEWTHGVPGHRLYTAAAVVVSIVAAAVQQSGLTLHRHFNHNDLMHVIQMAGVWLLYRGGAAVRDGGSIDGRLS